MNVTYRLPDTLSDDISKFAALAKEYEAAKISATEFKAFRVPMGVYEQRKDGVYMIRVRATGGIIHPSQLLRLIEIARVAQSDLLHITTRQEIQIQNLWLDRVEPALRALQAEGLASKGGGGNTIRNIMVSEYSGISSDEAFDTTPYAMELTSRMIPEPDSYLMPRKLKIAFSSDPGHIDYAAINDLGLVARIQDGVRGFRVYAGGGAGAKPTTAWLLYDFMPATDLYALVKGVKNFFSDHGNRKNRSQARIRFIFYKLGAEETLRLIREYVDKERPQAVPLAVDESVEERPAYTYHAVPRPWQASEQAAYVLWLKRYAAPQRQAGYYTVLFPTILGNIPLDDDRVERLEKLLRFIRRFGEHTLRFTNTQDIRLRNLPQESLPELYDLLRGFTDETAVPAVVNNIVSCTGADTCRLGIGLSKGLAAAIRQALLRSTLDLDRLNDVSIHVTGCPNSCGQQLWADLGFAGRVLRNDRVYPGYQVYLAANRTDDPSFAQAVGNISARDVPAFVCRLFDSYLQSAAGRSFPDYLRAEGRERVLQLLAEYKTIPSFADDKNYYFDWGADELFSVGARGKAECAAGLFDMIKVDQDAINENRKKLAGEPDPATADRLVYGVIYAASRMLLVTRGLDPRNRKETFDLFTRYFIDEGYVGERYKSLVAKAEAEGETGTDYLPLRDEAFALADEVNALYATMDESMQFKKKPAAPSDAPVSAEGAPEASAAEVPVPKEVEATAPPAHRVKDLRGVLCPMNFVKTKLELAAMQSGELLEIWLDDGAPINNVPGSVRLEGHTVVSQDPVDNYWKVVIRKK